jgi:NAD(P)-dependent dehydrogenase (short-subunit alcohol dehydrogenase family)
VKILKGKTAVITGAGRGIGAATAMACAQEGMNVVLADVDEKNLSHMEEAIRSIGGDCLSVLTDVSDSLQVEKLAKETISVFKTADLLFNNAGVLHVASILEHTEKDWQWVLGVNLFGVINCVRVFAPLMKKQKTESHIINTASIGGFTTGPGLGAYKTSKHALIAFSEVLEAELADSSINVSVLCPGWTNTGIMHSETIRPEKFKNSLTENRNSLEIKRNILRGIESAAKGEDSDFIAKCVIEAVLKNKFYVIPDISFHNKFKDRVYRILEA